jgi:pimeloyl-ACP methyl ester carboxylesterase
VTAVADGDARIEVAGRRLEWLDVPGDPDLPALVLLHEGLGSVGLWRGFPEALAAATGRRAIAFSRFGHGRSDPPPAPRTTRFMHDEALEVLPAVLEAVGAPAPLLVGHSDGASIALIHASEHPTSGLALMAPHVFVEDVTLDGIRAAHDAFHRGGLRERMARHHDDPEVTFRGWCDVWLDAAFEAWNVEACADAVDAPVLLVQGERDDYGTLAQLDAIERRVRGPVERVVLGCGHAPHLEAPDATLAAVSRFAERLRGTPRSAPSAPSARA